MSEFKAGDLAVTQNGKVFIVDFVSNGKIRSGKSMFESDFCKHARTLHENQEIKLVNKPIPPKFNPSKCERDKWEDADIVAMDDDGCWYTYSVCTDCYEFNFARYFLYIEENWNEETANDLWRETKTFVRDILENEK